MIAIPDNISENLRPILENELLMKNELISAAENKWLRTPLLLRLKYEFQTPELKTQAAPNLEFVYYPAQSPDYPEITAYKCPITGQMIQCSNQKLSSISDAEAIWQNIKGTL